MELTIELRAWMGKSQELHQTLQALLPLIRKERGCMSIRIYKDMEDEDIFFLEIQWEDIAALEKYMLSECGRTILGAIDLLGEKAKVRIGKASLWEGIEVLKRMRAKA